MAGNFQVSSKLPDGRIFVVAGGTYTEFCEALVSATGLTESEDILKTMAASLMGAPTNAVQAVANIKAAFTEAVPDHTAHPVTGSPHANAAPSGRSCKHGLMTPRTGSGAKGPWKAYMCPSAKGTPDQCEPVWLRRNDPEWNAF